MPTWPNTYLGILGQNALAALFEVEGCVKQKHFLGRVKVIYARFEVYLSQSRSAGMQLVTPMHAFEVRTTHGYKLIAT